MTAGSCSSGKVCHGSEHAAKQAATAIGRARTHDRPRAYQCPRCRSWHLTSAPKARRPRRRGGIDPPTVATREELDAFIAAHTPRSKETT